MIDLETADGVADAYLARPDDEPRPAVLLVMDAYGLRPQIERMADQIVALGSAHVRYRSEVYRGAAHGYTMADTPAYDEAAAERHYGELFALLGRTVVRASAARWL